MALALLAAVAPGTAVIPPAASAAVAVATPAPAMEATVVAADVPCRSIVVYYYVARPT